MNRYLSFWIIVFMGVLFCPKVQAQQESPLKAQRWILLPSSVSNLSVVDGRLYCYSGGLFLSASVSAGTVSSLEADSYFYQYDNDIDYVTQNPLTGHYFFTIVNSRRIHKLYEVVPREGKSPKVKRIKISGVSSIDHPTFTRDGKVMIFSSPDGSYGGHDIYYSRKLDDDDWTDALSMGSSINTAGHELAPTVCGDFLYYSSLDTSYSPYRRLCATLIYGASETIESPSIAVGNNPSFDLPVPFNGAADNIEIAFDTAAGRVFVASERDGVPQLYAYSGTLPLVVVTGRITDAAGEVASGVDVSLFDDGTMLDRMQTGSDGRYLFIAPQNRTLTIWMSKPGNFGATMEVKTAQKDKYHALSELVYDARLDRLEMGKPFYIYDVFGSDAAIDVSKQGRQSLQRLVRFMSENPHVKASIGVVSCMSNDQYFNDLVTSRRIKNLQQYLEEQLPNSKIEIYAEGGTFTGNAQGVFSSRLKVQLD